MSNHIGHSLRPAHHSNTPGGTGSACSQDISAEHLCRGRRDRRCDRCVGNAQGSHIVHPKRRINLQVRSHGLSTCWVGITGLGDGPKEPQSRSQERRKTLGRGCPCGKCTRDERMTSSPADGAQPHRPARAASALVTGITPAWAKPQAQTPRKRLGSTQTCYDVQCRDKTSRPPAKNGPGSNSAPIQARPVDVACICWYTAVASPSASASLAATRKPGSILGGTV